MKPFFIFFSSKVGSRNKPFTTGGVSREKHPSEEVFGLKRLTAWRAPVTGATTKAAAQMSTSQPRLSSAGAPNSVHRHPSAWGHLANGVHKRIARHTPRKARMLAHFVISRSPARIKGLALERLSRISGDIEKCPACPQHCPVP